MADAERRSIHELVTRYEFEPGLKDIYVEGSDDKAILEGILQEQQVDGVAVFEISSVELPTEPGEDTGCRTKVVKLARALTRAFRGKQLHVACVIDSDLDYVTGAGENNALLLRTDYASMEMYFFTSDVFEKLNKQGLRGRRLTDHMVNGFMASALTSLFLIRCVNAKREWQLEYLRFDKLVSFGRGRFGFDLDGYVERYLSKNGCPGRREEFLRQVNAVELPDGLDRRCFIHGHDFLSLLRLMLNKLRGKSVYGSEEVVFNLLRVCANYASLAQEPMFATILRRFGQEPNNGIDDDR
jgi:hypothetical protein